ncbi:LuxR family transcriptional regulator [Bradyrhizobium sp. WSM1253]|uniref:helix-turn-helix transcriptional regulator n=1 Tax=Bradyrhizobium sp. WSM1253 TaxID=319003 RepID=UPI00055A08BD|nr:LuxR family transcriptional regulator [Bradyrhizobium sp. WSM1253]
MYRAFQKFVDQLTEGTDRDAAQQSMADMAAALNLSCFAYLALPHQPGGAPNLISTYPRSWTAHYLQHQYESFDPVVRRAMRHTEPFRWGLGFGPRVRSESEHALFEEAAKFGIRCGFTIPIHDNKGAIAAVTFASDERRIAFERSISENAQVLRLIAMFFHAHAGRMLGSDHVVDGVLLSPRELECLEWSSRGKSAWEIGNILGISRRTAAFHLDNARAKLGVRTLRQAVVRLAESKFRG